MFVPAKLLTKSFLRLPSGINHTKVTAKKSRKVLVESHWIRCAGESAKNSGKLSAPGDITECLFKLLGRRKCTKCTLPNALEVGFNLKRRKKVNSLSSRLKARLTSWSLKNAPNDALGSASRGTSNFSSCRLPSAWRCQFCHHLGICTNTADEYTWIMASRAPALW